MQINVWINVNKANIIFIVKIKLVDYDRIYFKEKVNMIHKYNESNILNTYLTLAL